MLRLFCALLLLCSCAALNTMGMSESCKNQYNACLNGCPDAARMGSPEPPPTAPGTNHDLNPQIASCTDACNKAANNCK
jgi:hypothetical protein